jgi:hypothetical protein
MTEVDVERPVVPVAWPGRLCGNRVRGEGKQRRKRF